MRRWLAIGAVVGFAVAVLVISVWGGPGDQPPAPVLEAVVDAGVSAAPKPAPVPLEAIPAKPLEAVQLPPKLPSPAQRALGAMGQPIQVEQPRPGHPVEAAADAGGH